MVFPLLNTLLPHPKYFLTINPLPHFCSHIKKNTNTHNEKVLSLSPTIKEENPRREKKRQKKEKKNKNKNTLLLDRETGWPQCEIVCERACAEVDAVAPGKVYVGHFGEGGEDYYGSVCLLFLFCFFEEGGKVGMRYLGGKKEKMMVSQAADVSPLVWL